MVGGGLVVASGFGAGLRAIVFGCEVVAIALGKASLDVLYLGCVADVIVTGICG